MADSIEYGCRYTGYASKVGGRRVTRYSLCGSDERGLQVAQGLASDTRAWQERQGLPIDAVVVCRPIPSWTVHEQPEVSS